MSTRGLQHQVVAGVTGRVDAWRGFGLGKAKAFDRI